ncbi:MAG: dockerin type I repeat-containing protein, partial [Prevotella sp.]|nr:dockerin type I repeat-containing protein [Prevotella sp.]
VERALPTDMLGDVNGDGRINIQDVAMLTGYINGRRYDSFIKKNADINGDGRINIADVALLVELVIIYNM